MVYKSLLIAYKWFLIDYKWFLIAYKAFLMAYKSLLIAYEWLLIGLLRNVMGVQAFTVVGGYLLYGFLNRILFIVLYSGLFCPNRARI